MEFREFGGLLEDSRGGMRGGDGVKVRNVVLTDENGRKRRRFKCPVLGWSGRVDTDMQRGLGLTEKYG